MLGGVAKGCCQQPLPCCRAAVSSCLPQELRLPSGPPRQVMRPAPQQVGLRSSQQSLPGRRLAVPLPQAAGSSQHRAHAGIQMAHNNKQPGSRRGHAQMIQACNTRQQHGRISSFGIESARMMRRGMRRASGASQRPSSLAWVRQGLLPACPTGARLHGCPCFAVHHAILHSSMLDQAVRHVLQVTSSSILYWWAEPRCMTCCLHLLPTWRS